VPLSAFSQFPLQQWARVKEMTGNRKGCGTVDPDDPETRTKSDIIKTGTPIALRLSSLPRIRLFVRRTGIGKEQAMPAIDDIFGIHATALQVRQQRMSMLASNIANASTPNYKARDLDFSAALELAENNQSSDSAIRYRIPTQPSLDGNTVEMATEQTAFTENAIAYRSSLSFLQGRIGTLSRALKGE
jgi:flagellar basal-body rod protein FlgB